MNLFFNWEIRGLMAVNLYQMDPLLVFICIRELGLVICMHAYILHIVKSSCYERTRPLPRPGFFWVFCSLCRKKKKKKLWFLNLWVLLRHRLLFYHKFSFCILIIFASFLCAQQGKKKKKNKGRESSFPSREACPDLIMVLSFLLRKSPLL